MQLSRILLANYFWKEGCQFELVKLLVGNFLKIIIGFNIPKKILIRQENEQS